MSQTAEIRTYDGTTVDVRRLDRTGSGTRLTASHPDGRAWVVVVGRDGEVAVEVSRRDGEPADLETPAWLTDQLSRLAMPA